MKRAIAVLAVSAFVLAAVSGVVAFSRAKAQATSPTTSAVSTTGPIGEFSHADRGRGFGGSDSNEDLATALGITVDELNTAQQSAYEAGLKKAVEDGLITQAQADEMLSNSQSSGFGGRWDGWLQQNGIDFKALLAEALGISSDELQAAYTTAFNTRIDQAVTGGNLTQEQADLMKGQYALSNSESFQAAIQTAYEAAVQQAVEDGVITQAQADLILANSANGRGFHGMPGLPGMDGGMDRPGGGGRHGDKQAPSTGETLPGAPTTNPSTGTGG